MSDLQKRSGLSSIEEAIQDLKDGKMIILVDDEDRENEGDLVIAAEKVTAAHVNFMAKSGRGLICLATLKSKQQLYKKLTDGNLDECIKIYKNYIDVELAKLKLL